jgi:hypothetical protein
MSQSLFASPTPAALGTDGSPGITTGTTFRSAVDGTVTHIRFYVGASGAGTFTCKLWVRTANDTGSGGAGTELASKVYSGTPATNAWNSVALDTPVAIVAGTTYRVGRHHASDYVATNSFFGSATVSGDLTADANGETGQHLGLISQGTFLIDASPGYPRQVGSSANYFVDIVFEPDGGSNDLTAAITLPALQASAVLAAGNPLSAAITLPALQASAVLAAESALAAALSLPALQTSAVLAARASLAAALSLPALDMSVVLSVPVEPVEDTSSPTSPISTITRPHLIATISREHVITTGSRGGTSA